MSIEGSATKKRADGKSRQAHILYLAKKYKVRYAVAEMILVNGIKWAKKSGVIGESKWGARENRNGTQ